MRTVARLLVMFALAGLPVACERPSSEVPDLVFGHCIYENRFSGVEECREFRGDGWDEASAQSSCDEYGVAFSAGACPYDKTLGACVVSSDAANATQLVIPGEDAASCASSQRGCEVFGGGTWVDGNVCGDAPIDAADDFYDPDNYYVPETLSCIEPLADEPEGQSEGSVCTWNQISGCTEEGRRFEDYASCETVLTQRPYGPVPPNDTEPLDDPRMDDVLYATEVEWVKSQVEACACVCCHKSSVTPQGASIFDTEYEGDNWVNSFTNYGLAFAASAFDSSYLGAFPPEENNGFGRTLSGIPSTDQLRMKAFFERELEHRGSSVEEWASLPPQPAIFNDQATFQPGPCEEGQGVFEGGVVRWTGGRARYVYVLEDGSVNPLNPPNLDKPAGTLWRVDTVPPAVPVKTGELVYGEVPEGHKQVLPADGSPAPLVSGQSYLLWALADIGVPMSRCRFVMP